MKIMVCYKLVPEEQDIQILADKTLDFSRAEWKIGMYDLNAVEAAVALAKEGDQVCALTAGGDIVENSKLKKAVLSRGTQVQYSVADPSFAAADSFYTAKALAAAIRKIGNVDLVLCGEGSGDMYARQVGSLLSGQLGWAGVNAVNKITVTEEGLLVERNLEEEVQVLALSLPAVLSVTTDINTPRIPGMKDILAAGKKESVHWQAGDLLPEGRPRVQTVSTLAPEQTERKKIVIEGDGEDQVLALYEHLRKAIQ